MARGKVRAKVLLTLRVRPVANYWHGGYSVYRAYPLGNDFCAFAIKDALVRLLDPKPPAYRR
jgi:hypothetical protein